MPNSFSIEYVQRLEQQRRDLALKVGQLPAISAAENSVANTCHIAEANLRHFYPDWSGARCREVIADVLQMQATAHAEQSTVPLMDCTVLEDRPGALAAGRPAGARIFCTYHVGSYRQFYLHLKKAGIDFLLLISGKTMAQQGEWMLSDVRTVTEQHGWGSSVSIIDAESPGGLLRAVRALRRGVSVLIYIDGNSGVGANQASENLRPVSFLGKELMARTGVAALSHITGAAIVPVVCTRAETQLHLTLHEAIVPREVKREAYVQATTQTLYDLLAATVAQHPGQWEGWLYLHKFLKREANAAPAIRSAQPSEALEGQRVRANLHQFAMLYFASQAVLLNKAQHRFTLLDSAMVETLRAFAAGDVLDTAALPSRPALQSLLAIGALQAA
jgi:lauroyl/myristoyl acyltransferase